MELLSVAIKRIPDGESKFMVYLKKRVQLVMDFVIFRFIVGRLRTLKVR